MELNLALNELLVKLFKDINQIEERALRTEDYQGITTNDMHVIEAIGVDTQKNMSSVAKTLSVTMGTLTIAVNSLVKKGMVQRVRSEEDRRVVLVSLTESGIKAHEHHKQFHNHMIAQIVKGLSEEETAVLEKAVRNLNQFFKEI
ncbi:MAG: MarR family transcriptional regulator [Lachnospiraceae bacterium]